MSQEKEEWSFTAAGGTGPRKKTRFNLLLLEHGEFYFQDYSVNYLPQARNMLPLPSSTGTLTSKGNVQIRGRLKLCSRGLLFEPADVSLPCVKYPFRSMDMPLTPAGAGRAAALRFGGAGAVKGHGALRYSEEGGLEGVFTMYCSSTVEMKANNRVGPYVYRRRGDAPPADAPATLGVGRATPDGDSGNLFVSPSWLFTFELLHTPLADFLVEAQRLREIALAVRAKGHAHEAALLSAVLSERVEGVLARGFDTFHLVDFREVLLMDAPVQVGRITPLLRNPGCLMVTDKRVYFQPAEVNNVGEQMASFQLARLKQLFKRRHMLRHTALELLLEDKTSGYFDFRSREERDQVFALIMQQPGVGQRVTRSMDVEAELRRWQRGEIDNYQYLAFLNTAADRSVNDLTQYPVYPWVISDYTSETLDLDDPATYRDLSKPIGALNAQRLEYFKQRLVSMPDPALHEGQGIPPPFLYGTHYSTPGYVLFFLVRTAPEHMLCLQNGRFDAADRMFYSMASTWESVFANHADLKELIPEFYAGSGKFLGNTDDLQLGVTQTGQRLGDVELPPWARSGRDFITRCRAALESAHVSARLHLWIDLIFGCKQRGAAALDADNLFYHLTYEGNVDLDAIDDPRERAALESQISEFGQTPKQLFKGPHPARGDADARVELAPAAVPSSPASSPRNVALIAQQWQQQQQQLHQELSPLAAAAAAAAAADVQPADAIAPPLPPLMLPAAADAAPTADGGRDESAAAAAAAALAQQLSDSGAGHNGDRNGGSGGASTSPTIMPDSGIKAALQIVTSGSGSSGGGSSSGGGGSRGGAPVSPRSLAKQLSAPCVLHSMPSRAFSSDGEDDGDEDDDNSSTVSGGLDTLDDMRTATADGASPRSSRARGRAAHVAAIGLGDSAAAAAAPLAFDALSPLAAGRPPAGIGVMGRASSLRTLGLAWRLGKGSRIRTSSETDSEGSGAAATAAALVQPDGLELQQQCSGAAPSLSSPVPWFRNLMSDTRSRGSSESAGDAGTAQQIGGSAPRILAPAGAWQLDASALVLKPGPTFAVHRDSITGISLTRTLDDSASTPATAAAAAAPPPSTPPAAAAPPPPPSPPPSAALLICTSSKDCSMKLTAILPPQQQQQQQQQAPALPAAAADGDAPSPSTPPPPPPASGVASTLRLRSPLLRMPSVQAAGLATTAPAASSTLGSPVNTGGGGGGSGGAAPAPAGGGGGFRALCRRQFVGTDLALGCCALTSDGKLAAAGCWDSSVVLYAVESASQVSRLRACHDDGVSCMALCEPAAARTGSGDGANGSSGSGSAPSSRRLLVTGAWDATVKVWGLQETGLEPAPAMDFFDLETPIHSVAIDPSGRLVAAGAEDGKVAVWEVHTGAMVFSYEAPTAHAVCAVLWVRRGFALCIMMALTSGYICRHSESGTLEGCLDLSMGVTTMLSDGYTTIVACANGNVRILASCDADTAEAAFKQVARFDTAATPSGGMLGGGATASAAITCMAIAPAAAPPPPPPSPPEPPPAAAAAAAISGSDVDACLLVAGLEDGSVRLWTLQHAP